MKNNKKITIISSVHKWNDTRIFHKEVFTLSKEFNVELHALANFKKKQIGNINVKGLPQYKKRVFRSLNWIRLLFRILKSKTNVVHFHDPELIILGLFLKFFTTKKIVYDIHEDHQKNIRNKAWLGPIWFRNIMSIFFNIIEKSISYFFDLNILVLDKWKKKYRNSIVIKNYPIIETLNFKNVKKKNHIVYVGSLVERRGIEEMIESFNLISNENIIFNLIGGWGDKNLKQKLMPKIEGNKNINYLGYLSFDQVKKYLKEAKLGICLYTSKKYEENIPVKMYEYLSYYTPVLYSNFESWENKIKKEGWGVSVNPSDINDISKTIENYFLFNQFEKKIDYCIKYRKKYNWKTEGEKLLSAYNNLLEIS